jgi:hypothetical protein
MSVPAQIPAQIAHKTFEDTPMRMATASQTFDGSVHEAEAMWYDTSRWPAWIPGLEQIEEVGAAWPDVGGRIRWRSGPAGRGRVVEQVVAYEPLGGQTVEVEDDSIEGQQTVSFEPKDGQVMVSLSLAYRLKQGSLLMPVVDLLFIRGAMRRALEQTLTRFGAELQESRGPGVG